MEKLSITPVILCGGSGTRLWPLSRAGFPKQFLVLSGTTSLFQQAVHRLSQLKTESINVSETLVVTNEEHRFLAQEQLREMQMHNAKLILEPAGKNTAPALTLAALQAVEAGADPVLVVTPADQTIQNEPAFHQALVQSIHAAADGGIVILGVTPTAPEVGYGYIQQTGSAGAFGEFKVAQFAEKPNLETANAYLKDGQFSWNSGMFVLRASTWLKAAQHFCPELLQATQIAWRDKSTDSSFVRPNKEAFLNIAAESIDYAVMEKCPNSSFPIHVVPLDAGWSDLGAWEAVWQVSRQDEQGNVTQGDVLVDGASNTFVHASHRLVGVVGVDNLIVVETADAVLVADKTKSQDVKKLVLQLEKRRRTELVSHRQVHRPWGWYDSIDEAERFKVKRIQVKPGASLSLQKHHHRAEHWVVVKGTAEVTFGDKKMLISENQSTYIPLGEVHRLTNPGSIPLEIIEVQSGSYLGEDDIVRFEDTYGRSSS